MGVVTIIVITFLAVAAVLLFGLFWRKKRHQGNGNNQVYVGNLAYRVNEFQVKQHFAQFGTIQQVKIVRDMKSKRSKGFGFVTFATASEAERALKANGESFKGRVLVVRIAKQR